MAAGTAKNVSTVGAPAAGPGGYQVDAAVYDAANRQLAVGCNPRGVGRDKDRVYDVGEVVEGADPRTFPVDRKCADANAHFARVQAAGARILQTPTDFPYGERQYTAEALGGHIWTFSQSIGDVDPAEWGGTLVDASRDSSR